VLADEGLAEFHLDSVQAAITVGGQNNFGSGSQRSMKGLC